MDDAALVGGLDDLGDALEEGDELIERHGAARLEPLAEGDALDELHGDPEEAIVLGAERVDVRCVRMLEPRRESRFAKEALSRGVVPSTTRVEDLDDGVALEHWLLAAIDSTVPSGSDLLVEHELTQSTP